MHRLFRRNRLSATNQSNAQSFVESSSRSCYPVEEIKSPKTLRLGPYYIQVGRRSEKSNPTTRGYKRSELSGEICRVELPALSSERPSKDLHAAINEGQISELPAYQPEELPAYDSNMSFTYGYEDTFRSESKVPDSYDFQCPPYHKQVVSPMRRMGHQLLPTVMTSIPSPSINIEQVESTTPSLASGNSSQIPSPISPLTPSSAISQSSCVQQEWSIVSPISTTKTSNQFLVPPSKCVHLEEFAYNYGQDDYPNSTSEPSFVPPLPATTCPCSEMDTSAPTTTRTIPRVSICQPMTRRATSHSTMSHLWRNHRARMRNLNGKQEDLTYQRRRMSPIRLCGTHRTSGHLLLSTKP
jgi:hypothetical protein